MGTTKTIHVIKKLGEPTKRPEMLVCYDFHSRMFNEEEDLMFVTEMGTFSIGTIYILTPIRSKQHVSLISSTCLNLVE